MKRVLLKNRFSLLVTAGLVVITSCHYNTTPPQNVNDTIEKQEVVVANKPAEALADTSQPASKPADSASNAWLLVPGQSAGLTRINENAEDVYKKLGSPDGGDAAMQKAVAIWYSNHDSTNHSVAIYTAREPGVDPVARIQQIRVTSPTFKTAEGVGPGSTITDIRKAFSVLQTEQYNDAGVNYKVYNSPQGIAFETNANGRCVAVVINAAGVTGQGTYLKFRTTNKFINRRKV